MVWTMDILSLTGATTTTAHPFRSARITWAQDGTGAAEVSLRASAVSAGLLRAGQKRIAFRDSGSTRRFQGWLDLVERAGPPSDIQYRASARGLSAMLEQRVVHGDVSYVNVAGATIGWNLITHAQAQTDGAMGFTLGTITGTVPNRTRDYCDGDVISEMIAELAERDTAGFAWEIDADGKYNAWLGGRGTDVTGSVTIDPTQMQDWNVKEDMSEFASYVTTKGDYNDDQPCGAPLVTVSTGGATWGRREYVVTADSVDTTDLTQTANEELNARSRSRINLRTTWVEGQGPWTFGTRWLGDKVTAALGTPFGGNTTVECIAISITLEGRNEFVEMEWRKA